VEIDQEDLSMQQLQIFLKIEWVSFGGWLVIGWFLVLSLFSKSLNIRKIIKK
jgi:hypothetical protein